MMEDRPATQSEAYREMVQNIGSDNADSQWILTPFDTWEKNPAYVGPDQPHPEDYTPEPEPVRQVKDDPACETAFRQAMKDMHGQPFLFDYQLEMSVADAWNQIHSMRHYND